MLWQAGRRLVKWWVEEQTVLAVHLLYHCIVCNRGKDLGLGRVRENVRGLIILCSDCRFVLRWLRVYGLITLMRHWGAGGSVHLPGITLCGVATSFRIHYQQLKLLLILPFFLCFLTAFGIFCFLLCFLLCGWCALLDFELLSGGQHHTPRGHHIADLGIEICVDPSLGLSSLNLIGWPLASVHVWGSVFIIVGGVSILRYAWQQVGHQHQSVLIGQIWVITAAVARVIIREAGGKNSVMLVESSESTETQPLHENLCST